MIGSRILEYQDTFMQAFNMGDTIGTLIYFVKKSHRTVLDIPYA
jgi:hypothetical protein